MAFGLFLIRLIHIFVTRRTGQLVVADQLWVLADYIWGVAGNLWAVAGYLYAVAD